MSLANGAHPAGAGPGKDDALVQLLLSSSSTTTYSSSSSSFDLFSSSKSVAYLTSLTTQPLEQLQQSPSALHSTLTALDQQLSNLCLHQVPAFVTLRSASDSVQRCSQTMHRSTEDLLNASLPLLERRALDFKNATEGAVKHRRRARNISKSFDRRLRNLLEAAPLVESCIKAGLNQEAIALVGKVQELAEGETWGRGNVLRTLHEESYERLYALHESLMHALANPSLRLPAAKSTLASFRHLAQLSPPFSTQHTRTKHHPHQLDSNSPQRNLRMPLQSLDLHFLRARSASLDRALQTASSTRSWVSIWREQTLETLSLQTSLFPLQPQLTSSYLSHQLVKLVQHLETLPDRAKRSVKTSADAASGSGSGAGDVLQESSASKDKQDTKDFVASLAALHTLLGFVDAGLKNFSASLPPRVSEILQSTATSLFEAQLSTPDQGLDSAESQTWMRDLEEVCALSSIDMASIFSGQKETKVSILYEPIKRALDTLRIFAPKECRIALSGCLRRHLERRLKARLERIVDSSSSYAVGQIFPLKLHVDQEERLDVTMLESQEAQVGPEELTGEQERERRLRGTKVLLSSRLSADLILVDWSIRALHQDIFGQSASSSTFSRAAAAGDDALEEIIARIEVWITKTREEWKEGERGLRERVREERGRRMREEERVRKEEEERLRREAEEERARKEMEEERRREVEEKRREEAEERARREEEEKAGREQEEKRRREAEERLRREQAEKAREEERARREEKEKIQREEEKEEKERKEAEQRVQREEEERIKRAEEEEKARKEEQYEARREEEERMKREEGEEKRLRETAEKMKKEQEEDAERERERERERAHAQAEAQEDRKFKSERALGEGEEVERAAEEARREQGGEDAKGASEVGADPTGAQRRAKDERGAHEEAGKAVQESQKSSNLQENDASIETLPLSSIASTGQNSAQEDSAKPSANLRLDKTDSLPDSIDATQEGAASEPKPDLTNAEISAAARVEPQAKGVEEELKIRESTVESVQTNLAEEMTASSDPDPHPHPASTSTSIPSASEHVSVQPQATSSMSTSPSTNANANATASAASRRPTLAEKLKMRQEERERKKGAS
ncbi:rab family gtpase [Ceraceosorus bombacis]|uniref:Conserved oligomeric Golgi complex subunit 8 n=1 Tax=Ceraceosorus bombacis TaxID=401625 RepID=A0A0N7L948_9BASI|nr:rab family gtpase [Ceraceosorus bombacis]